jgi:hypothetical protein
MLLASRSEQQAAFVALARHLDRGGLAVVDAWLPGADDLARCDGRVTLEHVRPDPASRSVVSKLTAARYEVASQSVTLTTIYEESLQGGPPARWVRTDRLRLASVDELTGFAEDAGLRVERVAGGYDLEPIGPASDRAVVIAVRP